MKKLLVTTLTILGLFIINPLFSQSNTYMVNQANNVINISDYETAMDAANFDAYRYINRRRLITFDTGVEIELLSVYELQALNIPVNASKGRIYNARTETTPTYRLGLNSRILVEIENVKIK